ncbi:DUF488 domain-containing protein [Persephonella sp.]
MKIYTIGFSGKTAEEFFSLLKENNIKKLIDIRLNNKSQLAGFTNIKHLPYFLNLHNIEYKYFPIFAPTKELLNGYKKKKILWGEYEKIFLSLLDKRNVKDKIDINEFDNAVLLCSEPTAEECHRRLTAEYLQKIFKNKNIQIIHL